jgi:tetratricopeptide (TPR) repeat protein
MNINNAIKSAFENYQAGNVQQAVTLCKKIMEIQPNNINAVNLLGIVSYQQKNYDSAIEYSKQLITLNPNNAQAYYILGHSLQEKSEVDEAIIYYKKSLQLNPDIVDAYYNLGTIFQDKKRHDEAIFYYQKVLQINPNDVDAYYNLGCVFQEKEMLDEAIAYFQKALYFNPNLPDAYNNLGTALQNKGQMDEAIGCYKKALQLNPNLSLALLNLITSERLSHDDSKELLKLTQKLIVQDISKNDLLLLYFTMGKLCEKLEIFKESFEYYSFGNKLKRGQFEFNIDSHVDYVSRIIKTFSADFIKQRRSWGSDSLMPIFIFGMPRSGTTLFEQIIASHPKVYGGGESLFFHQIEQNLHSVLKLNELYPECLNFIDGQTTYAIADLYLKKTREVIGLSTDYTRITDKNSFNFYHLGLISLLFPKASFIHCQRHPLDTCISIFFHNFATGNQFAYDLSELGQYYRAYLRLMNHWREVLPIRIFELKYEDIVQQQEEVSQKLVEFCGLEWDSVCLDFYRNERPVFTASSWQVRRPIYTTSCGRWRNYEEFLEPLKELLADFI